MIGAIAGDIIGSRFEWFNYKGKDFELFTDQCCFTDDSVMSLAVCHALLHSKANFSDLGKQAVHSMQLIGQNYPYCGYGSHFSAWMFEICPQPYNSYGNGAAMRVSGCGYAASSLEEAKRLSKAVTEVSHNHPEGLKGAEATAVAVFMARTGHSKEEIIEHIRKHYYTIDFTLDQIRPAYKYDVSCQGSVPQAIEAFYESTDYEDAIRSAISIGGDSDTIGAIAGGIAGAYYGVPDSIREKAVTYLDPRLLEIMKAFENQYTVHTDKGT